MVRGYSSQEVLAMKHNNHMTVREMHDLSCIYLMTHILVIKYCRVIDPCLEVATSLPASSLLIITGPL